MAIAAPPEDPDGINKWLSAMYVQAELRQMAKRIMSNERPGHTLQPTALVNELYLRLQSANPISIQDQNHFYALAAQAMRRILVDYARSYRTRKRGGELLRVDFEATPLFGGKDFHQMVELDLALSRLEQLDARQCKVVELRYFAGLDEEGIARMLGVSSRTVKRDWQMAKAWLYAELKPGK